MVISLVLAYVFIYKIPKQPRVELPEYNVRPKRSKHELMELLS